MAVSSNGRRNHIIRKPPADLKFIKIKVKWHVAGYGYGVERHS
jgi:hypothetical protein